MIALLEGPEPDAPSGLVFSDGLFGFVHTSQDPAIDRTPGPAASLGSFPRGRAASRSITRSEAYLCEPGRHEAEGQRHDHSDAEVSHHSDAEGEDEEPDEAQEGGLRLHLCGRRVHVTLVRAYIVPTDVPWAALSLDTALLGFVYRDPQVSDQFLVFANRSFISLFVGTLISLGLVLAGTVPLVSRRYLYHWTLGPAAMLLCTAVDGWVHFFADLTPRLAQVRMAMSLGLCAVLVGIASWTLWSGQARCDESDLLPHYPGRKEYRSTEDLLHHCQTLVEPYPIIIALAASMGASLHPLAHLPLMVVFVFLNLYVGRVYADIHEPVSEMLVKFAAIVLSAVAASILIVLRFRATRAAFEATLRIEMQRQEAAQRAAELEHLLTTIVPAAVLPRLLAGGEGQFTIDEVESASMLFADMKGFTAWSSSRTAAQVTAMLNTVVAAVDAIAAEAAGVEKVKTVGDAYWAVAGIPEPHDAHADRLIVFAWHMNAVVAELNRAHREWDGVAWRVAVHSGPMTGALFGERQVSYEVFGETARIAQVVEANGVPGALCVTQAVLDSLDHPPPGYTLRPHRSLEGVLPHGHVLEIIEMSPPGADGSIATNPDGGTTGHPSAAFTTPMTAANPSPSVPLSESSASVPESVASDASADRASVASHGSHGSSGQRRRQLQYRRSSAVVHRMRLPSLGGDLKSEAGASAAAASEGEEINEAAAEEMARPRWRFLPWFADAALEAGFKARCEVLTRPNARAAAVLSLAAQALAMGAGFGEAEACYTWQALALQSVAAAVLVAVLGIVLHPRGPLAAAAALTFVAVAVGVVGLGVAALGGCYFAHDVMWLCLFLVLPQAFAVGPLSWPVFGAAVWVAAMAPGLTLSLLHSALGPANGIISGVTTGVVSVCFAFIEESALRRRFIEEELSQRCERQLQALGEERVMVLERLVPPHVVQDLIAWFGTGMDPQRSIARTYDRVVVAFLQLRPEADAALARLHADVDRDLDAANRQVTAALPCTAAVAVPVDSAPAVAAAPSVLDKIKTVGDIVMLAGPFTRRDGRSAAGTPSEALADEVGAAFAAVVALARAVRPRCPLRLGAHLGPVVGTVQGSSRLAFDTFGDVVNVASRVMSSAEAGTGGAGRVSAELHDAMLGSPAAGHVGYGEAATVHAKGKGDLTVFPVELH